MFSSDTDMRTGAVKRITGAKLEDAALRGGEGRVAPRRALSPRRLHRHQPVAPGRARCRLHNHRGTAEQWIKEGKNAMKWTAAVMLLVRRQRRPASASCADLQSRQLDASKNPGRIGDRLIHFVRLRTEGWNGCATGFF
jgi:hypothetical protein